MQFIRKYGTASKVRIPIVKASSSDFAVGADWTPAAGDVKISKDGGAAANITTLPTAIAMGNGAIWEFAISATEMQAAEITITVVDSATKAVQDQALSIITFGNASGGIVVDWSDAVRSGLTALPNANAAAAGGLVILGTNAAGIIINAAAGTDALQLNGGAASGATPAGHGMKLTGGAASTSSGGTAGNGLKATGGAGAASTNGAAEGANLAGGGTTTVSGADGIKSTGTGNLNGIEAVGAGSGDGIAATGGATGNGAHLVGGATSGAGVLAAATTSGDGITATGVGTTKHGINATGGSTSSDGIRATGGGTGHGVNAQSGSGATGNGVNAASNATNGDGIKGAGAGSGHGADLAGGATGNGAKFVGGGTSGHGIAATTTSGDGVNLAPTAGHGISATANGTSKHGMVLTGGTAGTSDGLSAVAGTGGVPIRGAITGDITGNLSGSVGSVTGAVGSVTGNVGGNVVGSVASVTGNVGGNVVGSVASVTAGVTVSTNNDKTGYGLSSAAVQAIWDALTSALTTVGSIGKLLVDNVNATISSRLASASISLSGGAVTVGTNNDKTGYALTADFRIKKNTALANFPFVMTDSSDHVSPKTGLTVTGQVSIDGAAFAGLTNAVSELSNGWYTVNLAAADVNGDTVALKFTATGADPLNLSFVTQTE